MPKKRSRSRSKDRDDRKTNKKLRSMQEQIDGLTKCVTEFIKSQQKENITTDDVETYNEHHEHVIKTHSETSNKDSQISHMDAHAHEERDHEYHDDTIQEQTWNQEFLEMMGEELPSTSQKTEIDETIQKQWSQWMTKGLPEESRKDLLKKYSRDGTFRTEAPKVNLEIVSHLTEIAKKRDQHFTDTQNCVGTSLTSLGAAISLLIENPEEGVDHMQLMKYLWDSGKMLADIFHQQSVARKSFITPNLDKDIKSTLEATDSDEWLYGTKLNDQVKDAKNIKKASASLKSSEKPPVKKFTNQVNWRGPPAKTRQVGYYPRRQFTNVKFKPKPFQPRFQQNPGRPMTQRPYRPPPKK